MSLPNIATYSKYGGEMLDYAPAVDASTDLSAAADNEARADTSAMTRTAIRAFVRFSYAASVVTVLAQDATWGNGTVPTVTRTGAGVFTITWPASVVDARGNTQSLSLRCGWANSETPSQDASLVVTGPNTATLTVSASSTGLAADPTAGVAGFVI